MSILGIKGGTRRCWGIKNLLNTMALRCIVVLLVVAYVVEFCPSATTAESSEFIQLPSEGEALGILNINSFLIFFIH